eukprot:scaffold2939_cov123-Cylindrotheca_fusiformis.AAC.8
MNSIDYWLAISAGASPQGALAATTGTPSACQARMDKISSELRKATLFHCNEYLSNMLSVLNMGELPNGRGGFMCPCRNSNDLVAAMARENSPSGRASFVYCFVVEFALLGTEAMREDKMSVCSEIARTFSAQHDLDDDFEIVKHTAATTEDGCSCGKTYTVHTLCQEYVMKWRKSIRRRMASKRGLLRPTISIASHTGMGREGKKSRFHYNRVGDTTPASITIDYLHHPDWSAEWKRLCERVETDWSIHGFVRTQSIGSMEGAAATTTSKESADNLPLIDTRVPPSSNMLLLPLHPISTGTPTKVMIVAPVGYAWVQPIPPQHTSTAPSAPLRYTFLQPSSVLPQPTATTPSAPVEYTLVQPSSVHPQPTSTTPSIVGRSIEVGGSIVSPLRNC